MKILQKVQQNLAMLGFAPNQQPNSNRILGRRQAFGIYFSAMRTCLASVYFLHVAHTLGEYMYSFFTLLASSGFTASHISLAIKNDQIFNIIDTFEKLMNESEFQEYNSDFPEIWTRNVWKLKMHCVQF